MKILLVSANREQAPYPVMPVGLAFVASWLKKERHDVRFLDLCFEKNVGDALRRSLASFDPGLIGISLRNLDNCDFISPKSFIPEAAAVVQHCRRLSDAPIALGGSAIGVFPEGLCRILNPDYVIPGDGEWTFGRLAEKLEKGEDPAGAPGIGCVRDSLWHFTAADRSLSFEENVFPRIFEWCDLRPYIRRESFYPLQTKRGCALKCVYCTYKNIEGQSYRFNPPARVADEIEEILSRHPDVQFEFVDSTFNSPSSHAFALLREIERRGIRARFVGSGVNPISAPSELFAQMKRCGFKHIVCTPESGSEKVLANLKKGFTRKHLLSVARSVRKEGLQTLWIFLMGGPGEDKETVKETLDFIHEETGPTDVSYITSGLRIYPKTEMAQIALKEGVIPNEEQLIEPTFYFSSALTPQWLAQTLAEHSGRDPRILRSVDTENRWVPRIARLIHALGNKKPFWTYAPMWNRLLNWRRAYAA